MQEPWGVDLELVHDRVHAARAVQVLDVIDFAFRRGGGAMRQMLGVRRETAAMSSSVNFTPPSCAIASRCSTVLVDPPMAMSSVIALSRRGGS